MRVRMAWRNLWRHRGRTLTMISAVALSYALMLVAFGINDDSHARMLREAAAVAGGDVLVHGEGYWATRSGDLLVRDADATLAAIRSLDGVLAAVPRVITHGLASTAADSRPVLLQGTRPALETGARDSGGYGIRRLLEGENRTPLVLGARLAERLEAEPGDRVVLTAATPTGELTRALFHLTGVLETGTREMDEVAAFTTLEAAQSAFDMPNAVTQIGVVADRGADVEELARRVAGVLGSGSGLEVLTWREAVPEMVALIEIDDAFSYIFIGIIYAIVLFSITNTFLMSVMERVREFGLLNALGMRSARIARLMLAETVLMTAVAMATGLALGFSGHLAISRWGMSAAAYGLDELELAGVDFADLVVYSVVVPSRWVLGSVAIAVATMASALYPAWRASRLAPSEAMRFYE